MNAHIIFPKVLDTRAKCQAQKTPIKLQSVQAIAEQIHG